MMRFLWALAAALPLFCQETTIRVDVQQVVVPVIVSDKSGRRAAGLKESDFRILEDGVPQQIVSFAGGPGTSGTYVICIDTLHTSPAGAARLRDTLEKLFDGIKPGDAQYVLIGIGRQLQVLQTATTNPLAILAKLRSAGFQQRFGGYDGSAFEAQLNALKRRMEEFCRRCACSGRQAQPQSDCGAEIDRIKQEVDSEASQWVELTKGLVDQFRSVVDELAKIQTGRTMIFVSDGFSTDPRGDFYRVVSGYLPGRSQFAASDSTDAILTAVMKTAADKNIRIDTVDSRVGAVAFPGAAASIDASSSGSLGTSGTGGTLRPNSNPGVRGTSLNTTSVQPVSAGSVTSRNMEQLANATGGVYSHDGDMLKEFRNALADGREYYVLTYTPRNTAHDGGFRRIEVQSSNPKLILRAKSGYWAPTAQ
jgi:VWFA-related protein